MEHRKLSPGQITAIVFSGFGVGYLSGLSLSPVAQAVIAALIGGAAALVAAFTGMPIPVKKGGGDDKDTSPQFFLVDDLRSLSAAPLAFLVVSVAIGASGGIYVRAHNWLGANMPAAKATAQSQTGKQQGSAAVPDYRTGGLFAGKSVKPKLLATHDRPGPIIAGLAGSENSAVRRFAERLQEIEDGGAELNATAVLQVVCQELIEDE